MMTRSLPLSELRKTRALSARPDLLTACDTESLQRMQVAKASGRGCSGASAFKPAGLCATPFEVASVFVIAPKLTVSPAVALRFLRHRTAQATRTQSTNFKIASREKQK
jgi:hypothetical protein